MITPGNYSFIFNTSSLSLNLWNWSSFPNGSSSKVDIAKGKYTLQIGDLIPDTIGGDLSPEGFLFSRLRELFPFIVIGAIIVGVIIVSRKIGSK